MAGEVMGSEISVQDVSHVNAYVHLSFYPLNFAVTRGTLATGFVNVTVQSDVTPEMPLKLHMCCVDAEVASMTDPGHVIELPRNQSSTIFNISIRGLVLGRTAIRFYISRNVTLLADVNRTSHAYDVIVNHDSPNAVTQSHDESMPRRNTSIMENSSFALELPSEVTSPTLTLEVTNVTDTDLPLDRRRAMTNTTSEPRSRSRTPRGVGVTNFNVSNYPDENLQIWWLPSQYHVMVVNPPNRAEAFLNYIVMVMIAVNLVGVGGQLDTEEVLYLLKKPLAVGVGLFCRFGVIPAVSTNT